ncbi:mitogen-activated protein kinase kinase kinase mlk-1 [Anaeramoeba ignava]|uniref:Mitogen-activated protein kinase kinase kinase mlk-1 n=1 Tax=Anaeramoeba ignava TaxID=1746090 RepID=A0A9Q0LI65_ANAIG|nr:mitogen-activated protein kinase kinase kinase mlk-1 [Anaeramoeba ignava]
MSIHFHQGSDVHSFGLFVWELMTFKQPYKNINDPNGSKYNNDEMIQIFEKSISCYSSLLQFVIRKFFYVCFINGSTRDMEYISELLAMLETQFLSVSENENVNVNVSQKPKNVQMIQSKRNCHFFNCEGNDPKTQTFENQRFSINQIEMILKEFSSKVIFVFLQNLKEMKIRYFYQFNQF